MDIAREHSQTIEQSSRTDVRKARKPSQNEVLLCPGCGCELAPYEIFAGRIRGLKQPVCIGCLASVLVNVRDRWLPLIRWLEQKILELADKIPYERLE